MNLILRSVNSLKILTHIHLYAILCAGGHNMRNADAAETCLYLRAVRTRDAAFLVWLVVKRFPDVRGVRRQTCCRTWTSDGHWMRFHGRYKTALFVPRKRRLSRKEYPVEESLRVGPEPILFRDAYWTIMDAKGILSFQDEEFADEFWKRAHASTAAFAKENGWTMEEMTGCSASRRMVWTLSSGRAPWPSFKNSTLGSGKTSISVSTAKFLLRNVF